MVTFASPLQPRTSVDEAPARGLRNARESVQWTDFSGEGAERVGRALPGGAARLCSGPGAQKDRWRDSPLLPADIAARDPVISTKVGISRSARTRSHLHGNHDTQARPGSPCPLAPGARHAIFPVIHIARNPPCPAPAAPCTVSPPASRCWLALAAPVRADDPPVTVFAAASLEGALSLKSRRASRTRPGRRSRWSMPGPRRWRARSGQGRLRTSSSRPAPTGWTRWRRTG